MSKEVVRGATKRFAVLLAILVCFLGQTGGYVLAATQPAAQPSTEPQALNEWTNWVASTCSTSSNPSSPPSGPTTLQYTTAGNIPAGGEDVGASTFGGSYVNGSWGSSNGVQGVVPPRTLDDNGSGNGSGSPAGHAAYAELDNGTSMGNIPDGTKLAITYKGTTIIAQKMDVGGGGGPVNGKPRVIDLWWEAAKLLNFTGGTDVVNIRAVDSSTPLTPVTGQPPTSPSSPTCSCSGTTSFGPGTLPSYVKEPYNSIFTAAGNKANVDPGVLVGIFYDEQYGYNSAVSTFNQHTWPDPPPPYGHGAPWSANYVSNGSGTWPDGTVGARGPFQFEPGTWKQYQVDGNGDGKADPTDLTDEAFGAAKYLAALGATNPENQSKIERAASGYSGGYPIYSQAAFTIFQTLKADEGTGSTGSTGPGAGAQSSGCGSSTASCDSGSTTVTGTAAILCEAEQYKGIYYLYGGGHGYTSFRQKCPVSSISSAAASSTAGSPGPCATDCSGLVSVAMDQAFNQSYSWTVGGDGTMQGSDSNKWQSIPIDSAQPGDVVTLKGDGHVEIVDHVSGGTVYTFGSHTTGSQTGGISTPTSYWNGGAWHWTGPQS